LLPDLNSTFGVLAKSWITLDDFLLALITTYFVLTINSLHSLTKFFLISDLLLSF